MTSVRRVWIVNHYAGHPSDEGGGSRHQSLAAALVKLGWEPTIIAASTDHRTRQQRLPTTLATDRPADVRWQWVQVPAYARHGTLRVWNMMLFALRVMRGKTTADLAPPHVVIGSTVHPLAAWSALRLARRHDVPFVFEVRDLWPETLIQMGAINRKGVIARSMRALEGHLYRRAGLIVTTMPAAFDYIRQFGIHHSKHVWISNGTEPQAAISPPPMNSPFQFLYFGAHGRANDLSAVLQGFALATKRLGPDQILLRLVGSGPLKPALINEAAALRLGDSVKFGDPVPRATIPDLAASADALVISVPPLDLYKYGISPNKLFDYLAAARPILFAGNPVNNIVNEARAGVHSPDNTPEAIASTMLELVNSTEEQRTKWGRNGFDHAVTHYSYEALATKLHQRLEQLVSQTGPT